MKTHRWLFVVSILFVMSALALSQPRMRTPEEQADQLKERLSLSGEQYDAVLKILKESREKTMKLRESGDRGPEMRDAFLKIGEETDGRILKVLNEDQQAGYTKIREERRQMMRDRRPRG